MNAKTKLATAAVLAAGLGLAPVLPAQGDQAELLAKRTDKLEGEWLKNADWITDYDKARDTAKETGKPIFAYFTRSYSP